MQDHGSRLCPKPATKPIAPTLLGGVRQGNYKQPQGATMVIFRGITV